MMPPGVFRLRRTTDVPVDEIALRVGGRSFDGSECNRSEQVLLVGEPRLRLAEFPATKCGNPNGPRAYRAAGASARGGSLSCSSGRGTLADPRVWVNLFAEVMADEVLRERYAERPSLYAVVDMPACRSRRCARAVALCEAYGQKVVRPRGHYFPIHGADPKSTS